MKTPTVGPSAAGATVDIGARLDLERRIGAVLASATSTLFDVLCDGERPLLVLGQATLSLARAVVQRDGSRQLSVPSSSLISMTVDGRSQHRIAIACPRREDILARLQGEPVAVMLYGSQARGDARADSDVDVLQVVEYHARSYSAGELNVSAYTVAHLYELSRRGSLYVRHLRSDGISLSDPSGVLDRILSEYREPDSYDALRRELAIVTAALALPGADKYPRAALRAASFAVRSLVYAACADLGSTEFNVERASQSLGRPQIGVDLRLGRPQIALLLQHAEWLLSRAGIDMMSPPGCYFEEAVVWAGLSFPAAGALLEAVLADDAEIDYTSLTLPVS